MSVFIESRMKNLIVNLDHLLHIDYREDTVSYIKVAENAFAELELLMLLIDNKQISILEGVEAGLEKILQKIEMLEEKVSEAFEFYKAFPHEPRDISIH